VASVPAVLATVLAGLDNEDRIFIGGNTLVVLLHSLFVCLVVDLYLFLVSLFWFVFGNGFGCVLWWWVRLSVSLVDFSVSCHLASCPFCRLFSQTLLLQLGLEQKE